MSVRDVTNRLKKYLWKVSGDSSKPIVFVGSSIIALWKSLPRYFPGTRILNTAVCGAQTGDILARLDELVIDHEPWAVCYYCGSNDINSPIPVDTIIANILETHHRLSRQLPNLKFVYLSIIRAPQKKDRWHLVDQVNLAVQQHSTTRRDFRFIDINPVFFNHDSSPRLDFYEEDQLHLTAKGYAALGAYLAPIIRLDVGLQATRPDAP
jgi:lysophospholipase L1-like esterase